MDVSSKLDKDWWLKTSCQAKTLVYSFHWI